MKLWHVLAALVVYELFLKAKPGQQVSRDPTGNVDIGDASVGSDAYGVHTSIVTPGDK